jgi:hypothetical protein
MEDVVGIVDEDGNRVSSSLRRRWASIGWAIRRRRDSLKRAHREISEELYQAKIQDVLMRKK